MSAILWQTMVRSLSILLICHIALHSGFAQDQIIIDVLRASDAAQLTGFIGTRLGRHTETGSCRRILKNSGIPSTTEPKFMLAIGILEQVVDVSIRFHLSVRPEMEYIDFGDYARVADHLTGGLQ